MSVEDEDEHGELKFFQKDGALWAFCPICNTSFKVDVSKPLPKYHLNCGDPL